MLALLLNRIILLCGNMSCHFPSAFNSFFVREVANNFRTRKTTRIDRATIAVSGSTTVNKINNIAIHDHGSSNPLVRMCEIMSEICWRKSLMV